MVANARQRHRERTVGSGNGTFAAATTYGTGGCGPDAIAVADFNADGNSDLAVENQSSGTVGVLPRIFVPQR